jgi:hypothetical protein
MTLVAGENRETADPGLSTVCTRPSKGGVVANIIGYAAVGSDGTLLHQFGVDHVDHKASGEYDVYFASEVAGAAAQVVSSADPGIFAAARGGILAPTNVRLTTTTVAFNPGGPDVAIAPVDATFQLTIVS